MPTFMKRASVLRAPVSAFPSRIRVEVAAEPAGLFPNLFSDPSAWAPVLFTNSKAHRMSSHACVYVLHDSRRSLRHGRRRIFQNGKIHCRIYLSNSSSLSWLHKLLYASLWAFNVFKMSYSTDRSVIRQAVFHNGVSAFMTRCLTCLCDSSWAFISSLRFPHLLKRARDGTGWGGGVLLYTQLTKICSENVMLTFPLICEILKVLWSFWKMFILGYIEITCILVHTLEKTSREYSIWLFLWEHYFWIFSEHSETRNICFKNIQSMAGKDLRRLPASFFCTFSFWKFSTSKKTFQKNGV